MCTTLREYRALARQIIMSHTPPPDSSPAGSLATRRIQPRFGALLQACRQHLLNHLDQQLAETFVQSDATLFAMADKAANNLEQVQFFDGMRELRRLRPVIVRQFHQQLSTGLSAYLEGRAAAEPTRLPASSAQLSLLAHEEHEEGLLIERMVERQLSGDGRRLYAVEQRMAELCAHPEQARQQPLPIAPRAIAEALRQALSGEPLPLAIRRVLYAQFDQQLMSSLDELYAALDQLLCAQGILPQLPEQPRPRRAARSSSVTQPPSPASMPLLATAQSAGSQPPAGTAQLFRGVTDLLSRRHAPGAGANDGSVPGLGTPATAAQRSSVPPASGTYSEAELLAALTRLQQLNAGRLDSLPTQDAGELKQRLHAELEAACTLPERPQLRADDADIIDLVGMLFAFILDDPLLPDRCKTVLSHLHTPYLKIALRDRQLFTQEDHPARRLLDSLARAGARFAEDSDAAGLLTRMQAIVETIVQDLSGDGALFLRLLAEFDSHVARLQPRIERREQRTLEAAQGRDRLQAARQRAGLAIVEAIDGRPLPPLLVELLESAWGDVLALIHLRQGEHSEAWRQGCQIANQLAWSCTPLSRSERARMQRERLALLEQLREGLQQLGSLSDGEIRRLQQDVLACQHAVQSGQPELVAELRATLPASTLGAMQQDATSAAANDAGTSADGEAVQAQLAQLQALPFGSLFAFHEDGQVRRLRLSWFSPATGHYLFIDPSGEHNRSWPAERLASALLQGTVRVLGTPSDTPLMERALQAIYRVLQRMEDDSPDEPR